MPPKTACKRLSELFHCCSRAHFKPFPPVSHIRVKVSRLIPSEKMCAIMLLFVIFSDVNYLCARNLGSLSTGVIFAQAPPFPVALSLRLDIQGNRAAYFQVLRVEHDQTVWVWWMKRVLRTNPGEPQFPGRPQRIIKKRSQGTSSSLVSYFSPYCSLMWDIRALQRRPGEPIPTLAEDAVLLCCRLACIARAYRRLLGRGLDSTQACRIRTAWCRLQDCSSTTNVGQARGMQVRFPLGVILVCFLFTEQGHCTPKSAQSTRIYPIVFKSLTSQSTSDALHSVVSASQVVRPSFIGCWGHCPHRAVSNWLKVDDFVD